MKNIIVALVAVFGLSSQFALGAEPSPLYVGAGFSSAANNGMPVSAQEQQFMVEGPYQYSRTWRNQVRMADIFLGYTLTKVWAVEVGYLGGGNPTSSSMTGTIHWLSVGQTVRDGYEPFSVTQKRTVSAWHISAVGEKPLTDRISVLGRVGILQSRTDLQQRLSYGCSPGFACEPLALKDEVQETVSRRTALLFGAGLEMAVTKSISARAEVMKSPALPAAVFAASLTYRF